MKFDFNYKYIKYFQDLNWYYTKDDLGIYFTKNNVKISIQFNGATYICFKNVNISGQWVLSAKQNNLLTDKFVYAWMLANMM